MSLILQAISQKQKSVYETIGLGEYAISIHDEIEFILNKIDCLVEREYSDLKKEYSQSLRIGEAKAYGHLFFLKKQLGL